MFCDSHHRRLLSFESAPLRKSFRTLCFDGCASTRGQGKKRQPLTDVFTAGERGVRPGRSGAGANAPASGSAGTLPRRVGGLGRPAVRPRAACCLAPTDKTLKLNPPFRCGRAGRCQHPPNPMLRKREHHPPRAVAVAVRSSSSGAEDRQRVRRMSSVCNVIAWRSRVRHKGHEPPRLRAAPLGTDGSGAEGQACCSGSNSTVELEHRHGAGSRGSLAHHAPIA